MFAYGTLLCVLVLALKSQCKNCELSERMRAKLIMQLWVRECVMENERWSLNTWEHTQYIWFCTISSAKICIYKYANRNRKRTTTKIIMMMMMKMISLTQCIRFKSRRTKIEKRHGAKETAMKHWLVIFIVNYQLVSAFPFLKHDYIIQLHQS